MTELDDELLPEIYDLIQEIGKAVTFVSSTQVDDPTTGAVVESNVTNHATKCVPPYEFSERLVNGTTVLSGDLHVMVAAQGLGFTITLAMRVVIDTVTYRIVKVSPIFSGELVAAYDVQVRR